MVVTPAGDPCIIAVPYQGTLNFASFFAPKKVREKRFFLRAEALGIPKGDACRSALPLSQSEATERTIGTQESKRIN